MGACCSAQRTCHDPTCDLPGLFKFQGCWRCDHHNATWQVWLDENRANMVRNLGHDDSSADSEKGFQYEEEVHEVTVAHVDTSVLMPHHEHADFEVIFNETMRTMFYTDEEKSRVPGLDRDVRRLLYDERKDTAPGYLYVFRLNGDSPNYYKIGYTKDIDKRMKEWRKKLDQYGDLEVVLVHRVRRARFAERAVHLLLAPHRLARYLLVNEHKMYTEYFYIKERGELPWSPLDPEIVPENARTYQRAVEWFNIDEAADMLRVCGQVVDTIESFY